MNNSVFVTDTNTVKEINLENIDFMDKNIRINTPISKKALFILGLDENKLYEISKEEYIDKYIELKDKSKDFQDKKYEIFNARRLKSIEEAKLLRKELIRDDEKEKTKKYKSNIDIFSYNNNNSFLQNKPATKQQIKSIIKYEFQQIETLKKNAEKEFEIKENLRKLEEEKKEENEKRKLYKEYLLEKVEKNQIDLYLKHLEKK